ncbi:MAG: flagellar assembly peptidoglycan hydrolase FlgJ [Rhodocyclaceae bacterium]|jgi:flagellar protein FlgJ|nr:flagellar assembly peptidoglycan hydrolase FlgJ [Rhodocyclaceae bacterium]
MNSSAVEPNIFDASRLTALKRQVKDNDPQALKEAARQFEALFLQMVLKSMRDATPQDGMFDSEQTRLYQSMLDQQLSQVLSNKNGGTGLAAMIEKQLTRTSVEPQLFEGGLPLEPTVPPLPLEQSAPLPLQAPAAAGARVSVAPGGAGEVSPGARDFVNRIWPHAAEASRATGVPAHFMVAQAALETGWGKSEPRYGDGRPSYNLFGIKAGRNWNGPVVEADTTEYVNGVARNQAERFRAYGSYGEAFRDYANLLAANPRYAGVLGSQDGSAFARSLQQAGYATDPLYAAKLERIISGTTLRQALQG